MQTKSRPRMSIITSARNESEGIPNLMRYISVLNGACNFEVEFIVIDNNSTDNSHERMLREFIHIPNVKIFRLEDSKSFQEGIKFAINLASSKNIVMFPSDLQHPVEDCIVLINTFEDALKTNEKIAIFTRRVRLDGFRNRIRGRIYRLLIKSINPSLLSDPSSPLKAFTLKEGLIPKSSKFLVFDIEFQYNWLKSGDAHREIDSFFVPRRTGESNFSVNVREILSCLAYVRRLNMSHRIM